MKRIQRKRAKGWRMPPNTVSVCRPGKWGNPIRHIEGSIYIDASHRRKIMDGWVWLCQGDESDTLNLYERLFSGEAFKDHDLQFWADKIKALDLSELKGKDLACFCSLEKKCHADVLIRRVNELEK